MSFTEFTGWEQDNAKFETQFERVVEALRADGGTREKAPMPRLLGVIYSCSLFARAVAERAGGRPPGGRGSRTFGSSGPDPGPPRRKPVLRRRRHSIHPPNASSKRMDHAFAAPRAG